MTTYEPGSVIAGYRIDSLIGRGGMAVVYRAEDMRLGRKVALKLLPPELADSEQFRQRFIRESRLAASLDHPNIVPIYEAGDADGQLYIAMRYVVGRDLKGVLTEQGGQLPLDWALRIFSQLGDALDTAHRAGLVHRDVKPANILVAEGPQRPGQARGHHVYLTDFGLTKRASELSGLTGTGHFLGTVDYVSPEQIQGRPVGPGTDIYALGCVLYECLTGQPPFRRDEDAALLWAHLVETPPPIAGIRPEVPAAVNAVVTRAMAKEPADRYGSCQELVSELESALVRPTPGTPSGDWRTADSGAGLRGAVATSDGFPPEVATAVDDGDGGSRPSIGPSVGFPAADHAPYGTAPSPGRGPAFEEHHGPGHGHDAGSAGDRRGSVARPAPLSDAGDRSRVGAAAAAIPALSTEGPRPSGSPRRRLAMRFAVVGLLVLALGTGAVLANLLDPVEATPVLAEPADSSAGDPFTPPPAPEGTGSEPAPVASPTGEEPGSPDAGDGAPPETSSRDVPVSGDTAGLYGGTGAEACSAEFMAEFFEGHPDRAAAWARAQGIRPSDIRQFLMSLTPVVLRTDTAVTNHGFRNGRALPYQSVLQAGTAVLVDERGVPRVRCACGNPLDRPAAREQVRYTGQTWPELGRRPVTVVKPAPVIVQNFTVVLVQQDTTVVVDRLRGSAGDQDEPAAPEIVEIALQFSVEDPAGTGTGDGTSPSDTATDETDEASAEESSGSGESSAGESSGSGESSAGESSGSGESSAGESSGSGESSAGESSGSGESSAGESSGSGEPVPAEEQLPAEEPVEPVAPEEPLPPEEPVEPAPPVEPVEPA
ncbi:protein kinase, partial [Geodermatophilus sp. YIM 151500]|uniref:serine/threonine protein kinase n=1 Tax=Geodermatophilus sp. YIM 151500 TaxID=2984531 RepID=UPI0021E46B3B